MTIAVLAGCLLSACTADVAGSNDLGRPLRVSGNCTDDALDLQPGQTRYSSFYNDNTCDVYDGRSFTYLGCLVIPDGADSFVMSRYFDAHRTQRSCDNAS
ncbi:hypothetical protein [Allobranchiibius sp. CTAmp26]|uniref:hypothetical protein n=1 Tax=Allobranchiibius sp. CTAmp26 TaxID=2815214 RepID=UPI001AA1153F|nr:hypothetical protein [Allobranchiibius sp. CTAmp26]MBO1756891.1 hypothetical protein [Allobranchiibius sp. CTAmp26]